MKYLDGIDRIFLMGSGRYFPAACIRYVFLRVKKQDRRVKIRSFNKRFKNSG